MGRNTYATILADTKIMSGLPSAIYQSGQVGQARFVAEHHLLLKKLPSPAQPCLGFTAMNTVTLTFKIRIDASQQKIFDYVSDWEKQSDWILFTIVKKLSRSADKQNANLLAVTKIGPFKLVDTMVITDWHPYGRIVVEHTGRMILGKGVFIVHKISDDKCEFIWQEITPVPFGIVGQVGLVCVKPIMKIFFNKSLQKLKSNVES